MSRPQPEFSIDRDTIVSATEDLMEFMDSPEYNEDRVEKYENHIFETIMEEIYGPDMWEWFREKQG